jgi:hypothetical protein
MWVNGDSFLAEALEQVLDQNGMVYMEYLLTIHS